MLALNYIPDIGITTDCIKGNIQWKHTQGREKEWTIISKHQALNVYLTPKKLCQQMFSFFGELNSNGYFSKNKTLNHCLQVTDDNNRRLSAEENPRCFYKKYPGLQYGHLNSTCPSPPPHSVPPHRKHVHQG